MSHTCFLCDMGHGYYKKHWYEWNSVNQSSFFFASHAFSIKIHINSGETVDTMKFITKKAVPYIMVRECVRVVREGNAVALVYI